MIIQAPRSGEEARYLSHRLSACKYALEDAKRRHHRAHAQQYQAQVKAMEIALGIDPTEEPEPAWLTKARTPHFLPSDHSHNRYQERQFLIHRLNESEAAYEQAIRDPLNESAARYMNQVKALQAQLKSLVENPWSNLNCPI